MSIPDQNHEQKLKRVRAVLPESPKLVEGRTEHMTEQARRPMAWLMKESNIAENQDNEAEDFRESCYTTAVPIGSLWSQESSTPPEPTSSPRSEAASLATHDSGSFEDYLVSWSTTNASTADGDYEQSLPPSTNREAGTALPTKRSHQTAFPSGSNSDLDDGGSLTKWRSQAGDDPRIQLLACPFYERDRYKYQDCFRYQLRRIKDVKQHINRKHRKPEFYCSRCFLIFPTADSCDVHMRSASCEMRADPQYDGITAQQKTTLTQYVSRSKSIVEQWYDTWDTIFPDQPRPKSVYLGNYFEEMMPLLRAIWNSRQSKIISNVVHTYRFEGLDQRVLNEVMRSVFDHFEETLGGAVAEPEMPSNTGQDVRHALRSAVSRRNTAQESILESASLQVVPEKPHDTLFAAAGSHFNGYGETLLTGQDSFSLPFVADSQSDFARFSYQEDLVGTGMLFDDDWVTLEPLK